MKSSSYEPFKPIWARPRRASKMLDVGLTKTYELINNGTLETVKLDGMRLVSVASIERLREQSHIAAAARSMPHTDDGPGALAGASEAGALIAERQFAPEITIMNPSPAPKRKLRRRPTSVELCAGRALLAPRRSTP